MDLIPTLLAGAGNGIVDLWSGFWGDWWPTITWGSAGEWVSGVGALATLLFTVGLVLVQRRNSRKEQVNAVSAYREGVSSVDTPDASYWTYKLQVDNASSGMIRRISLAPLHEEYAHKMLPVKNGSAMRFKAGDSVNARFNFPNFDPKEVPMLIVIVDQRGVTWYRNIEEDKYVSRKYLRKQWKKLSK